MGIKTRTNISIMVNIFQVCKLANTEFLNISYRKFKSIINYEEIQTWEYNEGRITTEERIRLVPLYNKQRVDTYPLLLTIPFFK